MGLVVLLAWSRGATDHGLGLRRQGARREGHAKCSKQRSAIRGISICKNRDPVTRVRKQLAVATKFGNLAILSKNVSQRKSKEMQIRRPSKNI